VPPLHTSPAAHATPQAPQWVGAVARSTHTPAQEDSPAGHAHDPLAHKEPPEHVTPQAPQFPECDDRSTQLPAQLVNPAGQLVTQVPSAQLSAGAHARPQPPQWKGSLVGSTQVPPQSTASTGHRHAAATQSLPPSHSTLHAPQ
jgi:hypothetical protein